MKKYMLSLLLTFAATAAVGQTIGDAFYIYRNDGEFNAFFREEVDSMNYSLYDLDSTLCSDYVTQVVYTSDSIYRIPLAAIDSVSFVTPEPIYQNEVVPVDATWKSYIISVTDTTITFRRDIPSALLPRIGQVIVSETLEAPFTSGFAGRVHHFVNYADSIVCHVEEVGITEIYERLVCKGVSSSYGDTQQNSLPSPNRIFAAGTKGVRFHIPDIDVTAGPLSVSCTPDITMTYVICLWEKNLKNYVDIKFHQTYSGSASLNVSYDKDYKPEPKWNKAFFTIPTSVPGLYAKILFGGFLRATGSLQLSAHQPFTITGTTGFEYSGEKGLTPVNKWKSRMEDREVSVSLDGSISFGLALRLQFGIAHEKLASADVTACLGPKFSGHFELNTGSIVNKTLYSSVKNAEIALSLFAEVVPGYRFVLQDERKELPLSLNLSYPLSKWYLVPEFSRLSWSSNRNSLGGSIQRNLLSKVNLGWALYDENDQLYSTQYISGTYRKQKDWPGNGLEMKLDKRPKGKYTAYPVVKVMGMEMRADESVEVVSEVPVRITDFKVTKSEHKKAGFSSNGQKYDYAYYAATTVELEDGDGVADWGYAYEDPSGKLALISLKSYGSPYTDSNHAYYRNSARSTVRLCPYAKYEGESEYHYGDAKDFALNHEEVPLCPDSHHPHLIDLGLPSGTKWACCNVGASTPEGYGGYFAWGETSEKSVYKWDTYKYGSSWDNVVNIGSDIAGTDYDVAHVKWQGDWRMPTQAQFKELVENTSHVWTTQNGVNGRKFTSKVNGNSIFLPAAGLRRNSELNDAGSYGYYLSSTLPESDPHCAYDLGFYDYFAGWGYYGSRSYGLSVRPVRRK